MKEHTPLEPYLVPTRRACLGLRDTEWYGDFLTGSEHKETVRCPVRQTLREERMAVDGCYQSFRKHRDRKNDGQ